MTQFSQSFFLCLSKPQTHFLSCKYQSSVSWCQWSGCISFLWSALYIRATHEVISPPSDWWWGLNLTNTVMYDKSSLARTALWPRCKPPRLVFGRRDREREEKLQRKRGNQSQRLCGFLKELGGVRERHRRRPPYLPASEVSRLKELARGWTLTPFTCVFFQKATEPSVLRQSEYPPTDIGEHSSFPPSVSPTLMYTSLTVVLLRVTHVANHCGWV